MFQMIDQKKKLHFSKDEFEARQKAATRALQAHQLDGVLLFKQESMYYLTGYDTMGYITFQCMYLGADGRILLFTREPDKRAARMTSIIEDVRIYGDGASVNPVKELRDAVAPHLGDKARLGVEYNSFGLKARDAKIVDTVFSEIARLEDASDIINNLRLIKSPAEIEYVRKAARLADKALEKALTFARPGISEGELFAEMQGEIFRGGGDYSASRWILGAGSHAILVRHFTGHHNTLQDVDQIQLEFGAAYLHYHGCLFHTLYVGKATDQQKKMRAVSIEALQSAREACRPGAPIGDMFEAYARVVDTAGYSECRLNACGYSLGATYPPTWMDGLLISQGNDVEIKPGMVFFPHMVLIDSKTGYTGCAGESILVTENGCEGLSSIPHKTYVL